MADVAAAKRYAQAAFDLARETSADLDRWRSDLDDVAVVLAESQAAGPLQDGRTALEEKLALVERLLAIDPLVLNLAKLLVSKGRSPDARAVADAFARLADDEAGVEQAEITTAVELSGERLAALEEQLSTSIGKRVTATVTIDPAIIGGLVVRVGDRLVDGSVRTRLHRLGQELASG
ncbi:MAG TPA: ATP synthase F1 subunit delta [Dehalococcoidia bacterium]|jgi:F-type H+-transporting ATPase subunit delta|nr:ATP synthase F1 subunit delta [Dehalococcoidia bacterium]